MEVLNNLKGLLNSRNLLSVTSESVGGPNALNFDAGAEILAHFEKQWEELHGNNEENANAAAKLAESVDELHTYIVKQQQSITKINQMLATTPNIKNHIETCCNKISDLHQSFELVEKALIDLEDLIEQCELQQLKHNHRYQLALYKEKKLANLETARADLAMKHTQNVIDFELKQKKALQERHQVFQEAFKNDLETYKTLGTIPKIESVKPQQSALLEEIQLDIDDKELNDFLES